jgi:hypothetical protein
MLRSFGRIYRRANLVNVYVSRPHYHVIENYGKLTGMTRIELSSLELDSRSGLSRVSPRPEHLRQPGYEEQFDRYTILYDLFWSPNGRDIIGIGPPLANLELIILPALKRALCYHFFSRFERRNLDHHCQLWLRNCRPSAELPLGLFAQLQLRAQPNHQKLFRGKKVALLKSRNNELTWIRDWIFFLAKAHGCNAVLFYDNASTHYASAEIRETIRSISGIETTLVIDWPFKHGPQGGGEQGRWDSDFSQYGILEHARYRFLARAYSVLQTDVDELVLTKDGCSIFDLVSESDTGYIHFNGPWIENATAELPDPAGRRHRHYFYNTDGPLTEEKWAVVPQRCPASAQWRVHNITGMTPDPRASECASLRHFKAINTNWKVERWQPGLPDPSRHKIDEELVHWLRVFDEA